MLGNESTILPMADSPDLLIPLLISYVIIMVIAIGIIYVCHKYNINIIRDLKHGFKEEEDDEEED